MAKELEESLGVLMGCGRMNHRGGKEQGTSGTWGSLSELGGREMDWDVLLRCPGDQRDVSFPCTLGAMLTESSGTDEGLCDLGLLTRRPLPAPCSAASPCPV